MANKKNGGVIPPLPLGKDGKPDERVMWVPVGCGKCMECMKQKMRNWQVRLSEEIRHDNKGKFVTLTFSNESLEELEDVVGYKLHGYEKENEVAKIAVRRFLERWRKKYKKSVKHWLVTELGEQKTERIHLHGIIFTDKVEEIKRIWKYGNVVIGDYVSEITVNYIVKYISKTDVKHREYKPIVRSSKGMGLQYIVRNEAISNKYDEKGTIEQYRNRKGFKMAMPTYYRNKIYSDEEREKLWIEKLDEEVRYINGIKVDVSNGEEEYYRVLNEERVRNKKLGYGNNTVNWERKRYENERRKMLKKERNKKRWKEGQKS